MPSSAPRIPSQQWNLHKETIRKLYLGEKCSVIEVVKELGERHGFIISKSQCEAQLRAWGFRKNLTPTERKALSSSPSDQNLSGVVMPGGYVRSPRSIKRAKRYSDQMDGTEDHVRPSSPSPAARRLRRSDDASLPNAAPYWESATVKLTPPNHDLKVHPASKDISPVARHIDDMEHALKMAINDDDVDRIMDTISIASKTRTAFRIPEAIVRIAIEQENFSIVDRLIGQGASCSGLDIPFEQTAMHAALLVPFSQNQRQLLHQILTSGVDRVLKETDTGKILEYSRSSMILDLARSFPDMQVSSRTLVGFCNRCMQRNEITLFRTFIESISRNHAGLDLDQCLAAAVRVDDMNMINELVDLGVNPLSQSVRGAVLLDRYASRRLIWLLDTSARVRPSIPKKSFGTRVFEQLWDDPNHAVRLEELLESGAFNLNVPERGNSEARGRILTPLGFILHKTAQSSVRELEMVERLLRLGANPDSIVEIMFNPPRRYHTALMVAADIGNVGLADLLIERGADVNKEPYMTVKYTPLQYAAKRGELNMIRLLLRHGADVKADAAQHGGGTALQLAAGSGNLEVVQTLIDHGAPLDMGPSKVHGRWPLEAAAEGGHVDVIRSLWATKSFFQDNENGFGNWHCLRAMKFAQENGHLDCRNLISELSGISVSRLKTDDYGVPWLAY